MPVGRKRVCLGTRNNRWRLRKLLPRSLLRRLLRRRLPPRRRLRRRLPPRRPTPSRSLRPRRPRPRRRRPSRELAWMLGARLAGSRHWRRRAESFGARGATRQPWRSQVSAGGSLLTFPALVCEHIWLVLDLRPLAAPPFGGPAALDHKLAAPTGRRQFFWPSWSERAWRLGRSRL